MTKPTTAECIDWLEARMVNASYVLDNADYASDQYRGPKYEKEKMEFIRAQLLAAQEMAKALDFYSNDFIYIGVNGDAPPAAIDGGSLSRKALTAWRSAGGE